MTLRTEDGPPTIIIGAGPVGLYTAFQLGLRGARPILIDALPRIGGQCGALYPDAAIYDAPGFTAISASDFIARIHAQLEPFAPRVLLGRRALSLWGSLETGFNVETDTGETVTGAAVVFAGGVGALRQTNDAANADAIAEPGSLELIPIGVTGLGAPISSRTGATDTPGVFVVGDAAAGDGRPGVLTAGFAEAVRAADAVAGLILADAPRTLPHSASSPALHARLLVA